MSATASRTLWVLRHAKAADHGSGPSDHARPLVGSGRRDATRLGQWLAAGPAPPESPGPVALPQLALCSDAVRTNETIRGVNAELGTPIPVELRPDLYGASVDTVLRAVAGEADDGVVDLMVVGHNPTVTDLAAQLVAQPTTDPETGGPDRGARDHDALAAFGFPTCGLAVVAFDAASWSDVARASGRLVFTWSPRSGARWVEAGGSG